MHSSEEDTKPTRSEIIKKKMGCRVAQSDISREKNYDSSICLWMKNIKCFC